MSELQNNEKPIVAICIPAYNNASGIERLLKSIQMQDYPNMEIHISDDSDSDDVEWLVTNLDMDIDYVHNTERSGLVPNRNAAVSMYSPEAQFIKIMTGDDYFTEPDSLTRFVNLLLDEPTACMAFSGVREVTTHKGGEETSVDLVAPDTFTAALKKDYRHLFLGNKIGPLGAIIYRVSEPSFRFDTKSRYASDMFFYFDILRAHPVFARTRDCLVAVGVRERVLPKDTVVPRDYRAYDDYNYMFEKYHLWESDECRKFMIREIMFPFNRSLADAKELHIPAAEYVGEWMSAKLGGIGGKTREPQSKDRQEESTGGIRKEAVRPEDYAGWIMDQLGKGIFLTSKADDKVNTMVIGWGGVGVNWNKKTFTAYIRENRHTLSVLQKNPEFTVNVPMAEVDQEWIDICGRKSGRYTDKIKELGMTLVEADKVTVPAIKELPLTLECRVLYMQKQDISILDEKLQRELYPQEIESSNPGRNKDPHYTVIAEILAAYIITE